jgi:ATP-dependent DNA ligase
MTAAQAQGLAAVIAKELDSPYRPGRRSLSWISVKTTR